ncbi:Nucleoporin Nup37, partial [Nowakowskiella sp. JEL0078]
MKSESNNSNFAVISSTELTEVDSFQIGSPITSIAWSPETTILQNGSIRAVILVAAEDQKLRILQTNQSPIEYPGHSGYINDVAFNVADNSCFASVSDDRTLRIWQWPPGNPNGQSDQIVIKIQLTSPGISVRWNEANAAFLMVAERDGAIRFLDWKTRQFTFSVLAPNGFGSLRSADWSALYPKLFGAVVGKKWYVWNLGSLPIHKPSQQGDTKFDGACSFRWSLKNNDSFAFCSDSPNFQDSTYLY